jgi:hypothetical protein
VNSHTHYRVLIKVSNDTAISDTSSAVRFNAASVPLDTSSPTLIDLSLIRFGVLSVYIGPSVLELGETAGLRSVVSSPIPGLNSAY